MNFTRDISNDFQKHYCILLLDDGQQIPCYVSLLPRMYSSNFHHLSKVLEKVFETEIPFINVTEADEITVRNFWTKFTKDIVMSRVLVPFMNFSV